MPSSAMTAKTHVLPVPDLAWTIKSEKYKLNIVLRVCKQRCKYQVSDLSCDKNKYAKQSSTIHLFFINSFRKAILCLSHFPLLKLRFSGKRYSFLRQLTRQIIIQKSFLFGTCTRVLYISLTCK